MGSGGKGGSVVVGHRYYAGIHMIACHGPVDRVNRIIVGEREAWNGDAISEDAITEATLLGVTGASELTTRSSGPATTNQKILIAKADLFGGDTREGGIVGAVDVMLGGNTQDRNAYLQSKIGADIPAYRRLFSLVLNQVQVSAINPYIKPWKPEVTRFPNPGWYAAKRAIGTYDANPAHIVVECLTNTDWGLGYNLSDLNLTAFTECADTLHSEGFGLSLLWDKQSKVQDFIQDVLAHVDAALYVEPTTGLFTMKLIRNDFIVDSLPIFDNDEIISVDSFGRALATDMPNTLTVRYVDRDGQTQAVTTHDIGGLESSGQTIAANLDMPGIPTKELALKVAMRELGQLARPLSKMSVTFTRAASGIRIGDAIRITAVEYGLNRQIFRVMGIGYGTLADGVIRMELIEDAFSLPTYAFTQSQDSLWTSPYTQPSPAANRAVIEAPWWTISREITGESATAQAEIDPEGGVLMVGAAALSQDSINFEIWTRQGSTAYAADKNGQPTPTGLLVSAVNMTETSFTLSAFDRLTEVDVNSWAILEPGTSNEEIVGIDAINTSTGALTVRRGVLDTVPHTHAANTRVYFLDSGRALSTAQYLAGESVDVKILTRTSLGVLALASAPVNTKTFTGRATRPYAPGNFKVNGSAYPATISGALALTWSHRNRLSQTTYLVAQTEGNIGPEPTTTYTLRLYGQDGLLKKTETGLTGTSYTWTTEAEDSGISTISYIAGSAVTYTTATSQNATIPATAAVGDLLLAWVMHRDNLTVPTGWTLVKTQQATATGITRHDLSVYQRTAQAGDAGSSTTWAQATSQLIAVQIQAWRHVNGATLEASTSVGVNNSTTSSSVDYSSITSTAAYQVAVHGASQSIANGTGTATTVTASVGTLTTPASVSDNRMFVAYRTINASGSEATGGFTTNVANGASTAEVGVSVLLTATGLTPPLNTSVRAVLSSVIGGRESHQAQDWTVTR